MDFLEDMLNEINEEIFKKTGDIRAEILMIRYKLKKNEKELVKIFEKALDTDDEKKFVKLHDYYAQIYLETENFMKELKGEKYD